MMRTGNDSLRIIRELAELGRLELQADLEALPALQSYEPEDSYISWDIYLHGAVDREALDEVFVWVEDD
ncbi:hypothetical protein QQ73_08375, partial [Candidatus Endoriftia persephone str. Guaymas]|nr:hypothetical protein [Candidatus Endoriftia persephone str. Guaymas]